MDVNLKLFGFTPNIDNRDKKEINQLNTYKIIHKTVNMREIGFNILTFFYYYTDFYV